MICLLSVYRPSRLTSEVRIVVSFCWALKKRAMTPPKPQLVSKDLTAKGKARNFRESGGRMESLTGNRMVTGMVSAGGAGKAREGFEKRRVSKNNGVSRTAGNPFFIVMPFFSVSKNPGAKIIQKAEGGQILES